MNLRYKAKVKRVVDGDTLDLDIALGFNLTLSERVRLMGVDTPEIRSRNLKTKAKGLEAKEFVKDYVGRNDGDIDILIHGFGKFGRPLVDIYIGKSNLNKLLLEMGLATPYFGGKK